MVEYGTDPVSFKNHNWEPNFHPFLYFRCMFSALAANKMFEPELKRKLDPRLGFAVQRFFCLGNVCSSHFFALFIDYFLLSECGLVAWFLAALIPCKTFRTRAQSVKCIWDFTKPNCEVVNHANKRRRILSTRLKMLLLELSVLAPL